MFEPASFSPTLHHSPPRRSRSRTESRGRSRSSSASNSDKSVSRSRSRSRERWGRSRRRRHSRRGRRDRRRSRRTTNHERSSSPRNQSTSSKARHVQQTLDERVQRQNSLCRALNGSKMSIGGKEYYFSPQVIAQESEYFKGMFSGQFNDSKKGEILEIQIPEPQQFDPIYLYLLTGEKTHELFLEQNFLKILKNVDYLQMPGLLKIMERKFKADWKIYIQYCDDCGNLPVKFREVFTKKVKGVVGHKVKPEND